MVGIWGCQWLWACRQPVGVGQPCPVVSAWERGAGRTRRAPGQDALPGEMSPESHPALKAELL